MYICVSVFEFVQVSTSAQGGQRHPIPLVLGMQGSCELLDMNMGTWTPGLHKPSFLSLVTSLDKKFTICVDCFVLVFNITSENLLFQHLELRYSMT